MHYLILIFLTIFNSLFGVFGKKIEYQISDREVVVNRQLAYSAEMLAKKYNIYPCATSVAMPEGDIQYLELEFNARGPLSQSVIRELLINSIHDFLENINNDKELCSYLKNRYLDISEVGIGLFFLDANRKAIGRPNIGVASIDRGELEYITLEPDAIPSFRDKYYETYEEALCMVRSLDESLTVQKRCNDLPKESVKSDKNQ